MLGAQVVSDLHLEEIQIPTQTKWGASEFQTRLINPSSHITTIKKKQLPLLALQQDISLRNKISENLKTLAEKEELVNDCLKAQDQLYSESVSQIFWKKESYGSFLNTKASVLQTIVNWKTLVIPGFTVLAPLIGILVSFAILKYLTPTLAVGEYLSNLKQILLRQMNIPSFMKARGDSDRVGFLLESAFISFTLIMFISGIWNQVSSALHLRYIWFLLKEKGAAVQSLITTAQRISRDLSTSAKSFAFKHILQKYTDAVTSCKELISANDISTFGALWNNGTSLQNLISWVGHIDVLNTIAGLENICIPYIRSGDFVLRGVYHPQITDCIRNDVAAKSHILLTGPNRGGKSTFCRAVGLAVLTAQSWGFAWASEMSWPVFGAIYTALENGGRLGYASSFEAEIAFAKSVLALKTEQAPAFVMMDEIFHSTNATDGLTASKVFLGNLYKKKEIFSLISTHYRELVQTYALEAQPLMLVATQCDPIRLHYTYKVDDGISEMSSVKELLYEHGLLDAPASA